MSPGAAYPIPVIAVVVDDEFTTSSLEDDVALWDDAYWAHWVLQPFSWQRFLTWWAARRWVQPREKHEGRR